ncbi:nitrile hydratase subunit beta [Paenibacillus mesophilus]|uniref:nitrile hydratase subunit beta n=1 Tax=Paenibacillus mesophilus TaxID=2582849 RepID=UPI00110ED9EA|nr:nitrile hydratase subunit beta [Paenibacillus mesophilus]TMV48001.1 nitrile hydratase subunit beta [Paenibacillus mesophilus]
MNRIHSHMQEVNWIAKLADLKEDHYRNTLLVTTLMDLLIEKGILTRGEIETRMTELDRIMTPDPTYPIS